MLNKFHEYATRTRSTPKHSLPVARALALGKASNLPGAERIETWQPMTVLPIGLPWNTSHLNAASFKTLTYNLKNVLFYIEFWRFLDICIT